MATIEQIITRGDISVPLSANYNAKQKMYSPALADPKSPVLIAMVTDALRWANERQEVYTQQQILGTADYLIWLTGKFGLEADKITGSGGTVAPVTPGALKPARIDFRVTDTTLIPNGGNTRIFTQFIGYEIDFARGGIDQSTIDTEDSYFTWNINSGQFFCFPNAVTSELFSIKPTI